MAPDVKEPRVALEPVAALEPDGIQDVGPEPGVIPDAPRASMAAEPAAKAALLAVEQAGKGELPFAGPLAVA